MNLLEVPAEVTPQTGAVVGAESGSYYIPAGSTLNLTINNTNTASVAGSGNSENTNTNTNTEEEALDGGEEEVQSGRILVSDDDPVYAYRHPQQRGYRSQYRPQSRVTLRANVRYTPDRPTIVHNPPPQQVQKRYMGGPRGSAKKKVAMGGGRG